MFVETQPTTLHQIFGEIVLTFKIIFEFSIGPDVICQWEYPGINASTN